MPSKGRAHFDTYTPQNRVKHSILTKYLRAYFQALSQQVDAFYYVDGFAGAGTYAEDHVGSPIFALELLARQKKPAASAFVETDPKAFAQLETNLRGVGTSTLWRSPTLHAGEFSDHVDEILRHPVFAEFRYVGTFAFIDPCGVKGLYIEDLARLLRLPFAECLVFFNYDGLSRWLGAVRAGTHAREHLEQVLGTAKATTDALACLDSGSPTREARLLEIYFDALRESSGTPFVLPFRFKARQRNRTSHYLIHLAQHPLGFKIMKDVMYGESSEVDDFGSFGFIPDEEVSGQRNLFRPNTDRARTEIRDALRHGPQPARLFLDEWPSRPEDLVAPKQYKQLLLALEAEKLITVHDPKNGELIRVSQRRRTRLGEPTLAGRYEIRASS